jgi:hypothetical protein
MNGNGRCAAGFAGCVLALLLAVLPACRSAQPVPTVTFDMLSAKKQAELRQRLGDQAPQQWWQIVQAACKQSAFVNCVCCNPSTNAQCNPNNWDCCASVVFAPGDGNECAFSSCACSPPPR